ncbi:MAG: hypothetical protein ABSG25_04400 [Bryobacteraceae bacterium]
MAAQKFKYKRLPGIKQGIFRSASLWLGDDHLLAVNNWRFGEDYKRYHYRDIQAIVITKAPRFVVPAPWLVPVIWFGILALILGLAKVGMAMAHNGRGAEKVSLPFYECLAMLAGLLLYLVFASLMRSCRCRIQTAVSLDELPSLYRIAKARKAVKILENRIVQAQGMLQPGWTGQVSIPETAPHESKPQEIPLRIAPQGKADPAANENASKRNEFSALEIAFYSVLALGGVALLIPAVWFLGIASLAPEAVLGIAVFVQQQRRGGPKVSRWIPIGAVAFVSAVLYCSLMVFNVQQLSAAKMQPLNYHWGLSGEPVLKTTLAAGSLAFAAVGAILAWRKRTGE